MLYLKSFLLLYWEYYQKIIELIGISLKDVYKRQQIKSQVSEVKAQVKSTAKNIVDEAKAKGRSALYRVWMR